MKFMKNRKIFEILKIKTIIENNKDILDLRIDNSTLKILYNHLANILLKLF